VLLRKSAKSPIESLSIRASRGWGTFERNLDPELMPGAGREIDLRAGEEVTSGGFERRPTNLLVDEDRERLVGGRGTSWAVPCAEPAL
jgi:hypothetical protein